MNLDPDSPLSAQAILRTSDGADDARTRFASLGFEVGTLVANSFAVSAPVRVFEGTFGVQLRATPRGGVQAAPPTKASAASLELPLHGLPEPLRSLLRTVTFTAPPDFGPTNW